MWVVCSINMLSWSHCLCCPSFWEVVRQHCLKLDLNSVTVRIASGFSNWRILATSSAYPLATTVAVYVNFTVYLSLGLKLHLFKLIRFPSTFRMGMVILWIIRKHLFSLKSLTNVYINLYSSIYRLTWCMYILFPCHWQKVKALILDKIGVLFSPLPPPTTSMQIEGGASFANYTLSYHSKSILDLCWIFTEVHQTFFQGELPVFW